MLQRMEMMMLLIIALVHLGSYGSYKTISVGPSTHAPSLHMAPPAPKKKIDWNKNAVGGSNNNVEQYLKMKELTR